VVVALKDALAMVSDVDKHAEGVVLTIALQLQLDISQSDGVSARVNRVYKLMGALLLFFMLCVCVCVCVCVYVYACVPFLYIWLISHSTVKFV